MKKTLKHALGKNLSVFCFIDDNFLNFIYTKTVKNSELFIATVLYQDIFTRKKNIFFSEKVEKCNFLEKPQRLSRWLWKDIF